MNSTDPWPFLPYTNWSDKFDLLHMKMQIMGKVIIQKTSMLPDIFMKPVIRLSNPLSLEKTGNIVILMKFSLNRIL